MNYYERFGYERFRKARKKMADIRDNLTAAADRIEALIAENAALKARVTEYRDAAEMLWVMLANVNGGDWTTQTEEWQAAARRWADNFHRIAKATGKEEAKR